MSTLFCETSVAPLPEVPPMHLQRLSRSSLKWIHLVGFYRSTTGHMQILSDQGSPSCERACELPLYIYRNPIPSFASMHRSQEILLIPSLLTCRMNTYSIHEKVVCISGRTSKDFSIIQQIVTKRAYTPKKLSQSFSCCLKEA